MSYTSSDVSLNEKAHYLSAAPKAPAFASTVGIHDSEACPDLPAQTRFRGAWRRIRGQEGSKIVQAANFHSDIAALSGLKRLDQAYLCSAVISSGVDMPRSGFDSPPCRAMKRRATSSSKRACRLIHLALPDTDPSAIRFENEWKASAWFQLRRTTELLTASP